MRTMKIIYYTRYLFNAKDQHSVHSPFVFDLLKNCIHKTSKKAKTHTYYEKLQDYLKPFNIPMAYGFNTAHGNYTSELEKAATHGYFIPDIHSTKLAHKHWKSVIKDKNIQISIDFWSFGLIFTKKDQEKEHFVLLKNRWR